MGFLLPSKELAYVREGLERLGFPTLREYEQSDRWRRRRDRFYRDHPENYRCSQCDVRNKLQLNHKRYSHLGYEPDEDLEWLCGYHHEEFHRNGMTHKRGFWWWMRLIFWG